MLTLVEVEKVFDSVWTSSEGDRLAKVDSLTQSASIAGGLESGTRKQRLQRWKKKVFDRALKRQKAEQAEEVQNAMAELKEFIASQDREAQKEKRRRVMELILLVGAFILRETGVTDAPVDEIVALVLLVAEVGDWVRSRTEK